ncbi:hypothetical protein M0813_05257 [Anaeramoeba flamelloides]|uniref:Uncharacterized protein n=1 Tax=Anaeramoeba flamelloides TaxID=1746091 RepID=A0ABQ8XHJ2_9EUKA|nr:hypothetical protein M0813_05257 [Anaeramoeba flamelloides]
MSEPKRRFKWLSPFSKNKDKTKNNKVSKKQKRQFEKKEKKMNKKSESKKKQKKTKNKKENKQIRNNKKPQSTKSPQIKITINKNLEKKVLKKKKKLLKKNKKPAHQRSRSKFILFRRKAKKVIRKSLQQGYTLESIQQELFNQGIKDPEKMFKFDLNKLEQKQKKKKTKKQKKAKKVNKKIQKKRPKKHVKREKPIRKNKKDEKGREKDKPRAKVAGEKNKKKERNEKKNNRKRKERSNANEKKIKKNRPKKRKGTSSFKKEHKKPHPSKKEVDTNSVPGIEVSSSVSNLSSFKNEINFSTHSNSDQQFGTITSIQSFLKKQERELNNKIQNTKTGQKENLKDLSEQSTLSELSEPSILTEDKEREDESKTDQEELKGYAKEDMQIEKHQIQEQGIDFDSDDFNDFSNSSLSDSSEDSSIDSDLGKSVFDLDWKSIIPSEDFEDVPTWSQEQTTYDSASGEEISGSDDIFPTDENIFVKKGEMGKEKEKEQGKEKEKEKEKEDLIDEKIKIVEKKNDRNKEKIKHNEKEIAIEVHSQIPFSERKEILKHSFLKIAEKGLDSKKDTKIKKPLPLKHIKRVQRKGVRPRSRITKQFNLGKKNTEEEN